MSDKLVEKQIAESKDSAPHQNLANELLDALKQQQGTHQSGQFEAHGQAKDFLAKVPIHIPDDCSAAGKQAAKLNTLDQLSHASKDELSCLYHSAKPGHIPNGSTDGRAIFMPGTTIGKVVSGIDNTVWKGKVFNADKGELVNRILGHEFVKAEVSKGQSWFDGKQSIIIDYKNTSLAAGFIRDEIREVKPGLYLGIAYARLPGNNHYPALFFALDSNKKQ